MPSSENACCKCVPRGCSCNIEPENWDGSPEQEDSAYKENNYIEYLDDFDRQCPCCEWTPIRNDKKTLTKMGVSSKRNTRKWEYPKSME
jgi:hypothetical protein